MNHSKSKSIVKKLLAFARIELNGKNPCDVQVHNEQFFSRVLTQGSLGLGESYMDKWWDCEKLDDFFAKLLQAHLPETLKKTPSDLVFILLSRIFNFQNKRRAFIIGKKHYDISNELYESMLDETMSYSCAYWKNTNDLNQAQRNKLELICQKLELRAGMELLDIGCGWGGLAKYAAENYGVKVTGITVSEQQKILAEQRCRELPVKILLQDYRDINHKFDRIASVGMFEHVGYKNYETFMRIAHQCLHEDGLLLLHTIGCHQATTVSDPWIRKYIFPNGVLPSMRQIVATSEKLFVMEDWHNFGADYDKTLMAWYTNFKKNWHCLMNKFDERFSRMWQYYLLACAGAFRARDLQLWQIVFSKNGIKGGYQSVR